MNIFLQELQKWLKRVSDNPFTWETLLLLSIFSWIMSFLASTPIVREVLARLGWLFLTVGVGWGLHPIKWNLLGWTFRPGPWITGALACALLFVGLANDPFRNALVAWPIISALIAIIPKFIKHGVAVVDPRVTAPQKYAGDRQDIINLILLSIVFSSWFQFHSLLQEWLIEYPSLLADSFRYSSFVSRVSQDIPNSRGVVILNATESVLRSVLEPSTWSEVERWLLNPQQNLQTLRPRIFDQIPDSAEDNFWELQAQVLPQQPEYSLQLLAIWRGPSSRPGGYYAEKICEITQAPLSLVSTGPEDAPEAVPNPIRCGPVADRIGLN